MAYVFEFPDVGEGIHEGRVVEWLVGEGDTVAEDQALIKIETTPRAARLALTTLARETMTKIASVVIQSKVNCVGVLRIRLLLM